MGLGGVVAGGAVAPPPGGSGLETAGWGPGTVVGTDIGTGAEGVPTAGTPIGTDPARGIGAEAVGGVTGAGVAGFASGGDEVAGTVEGKDGGLPKELPGEAVDCPPPPIPFPDEPTPGKPFPPDPLPTLSAGAAPIPTASTPTTRALGVARSTFTAVLVITEALLPAWSTQSSLQKN